MSNILLTKVPERKKRERKNGTEGIFEEITTKNFLKLMEDFNR